MPIFRGGGDDFATRALMAVAGGVPQPSSTMTTRIPPMPTFPNIVYDDFATRALMAVARVVPHPASVTTTNQGRR